MGAHAPYISSSVDNSDALAGLRCRNGSPLTRRAGADHNEIILRYVHPQEHSEIGRNIVAGHSSRYGGFWVSSRFYVRGLLPILCHLPLDPLEIKDKNR